MPAALTRDSLPAPEYPTLRAAAEAARAAGGRAVFLGGRNLVLTPAAADRLEAAGVGFAYAHVLHGRVVTIPVND
jgi:hypothetical protein